MKQTKQALEIKNLSISWDQLIVLNKLNLKLNEGEKLAIVGPSGSGKSTILKIVAGLILPTEGIKDIWRKTTIFKIGSK